ncbi:MAG TPA: VOC family protein [Flavobacteriaceae bacterium]|nr:VOC family protein [Flavobacteriaceae bacterium]
MELKQNKKHIILLAFSFIAFAVFLTACADVKNKNNTKNEEKMETVSVRYIVNDVEKAMAFYKDNLNFKVEMHPAPGFALLSKGNLRLMLNQPGAGGAGQNMPDGTQPKAGGGWNRIQIPVDDLESFYNNLKKKGLEFRNEIVEGNGGKQVLLKDPSGNLIELFESNRKQ